jgi:hypothetical protein
MIDDKALADLREKHGAVRAIDLSDGRTFVFKKARAADFYAAEHGTDAEVAAAQAEWAAAMKAHVAAVTNLAWAEADAVHEGRMPLSTAR